MIDRLIDPASREPVLRTLYGHLRFAECCAIVGLNDSGKTTLLGLAQQPDVVARFGPPDIGAAAGRRLFVHVDCNLLAAASEHDMYAVMAQATLLAARRAGLGPAAERAADLAQHALFPATTPVLAAVALESLVAQLVEADGLSLVYLFDEFDALYRRIEPRAALVLRAIHNRVGPALSYVLALEQPLRRAHSGQPGEAAEFEELFTTTSFTLPPLDPEDAAAFVVRYVESRQVAAPTSLAERVAALTGGHPGLLWATCAAAARLAPRLADTADELEAQLVTAPEVVAECENVWLRLAAEERAAVEALRHGHGPASALASELRDRGLLEGTGGRLAIPLLERYLTQAGDDEPAGLRVDATTGQVVIDGAPLRAQLGPTEFRLLQVLAERPGALVTKDEVVRLVWPGEARINGVDDARIDKLVDRVRSKIEPDPKNPRFLVTVRGMGYRLLTAPER